MAQDNQPLGLASTEQLASSAPKRAETLQDMIARMEREQFDAWAAAEGYGIDDMLAPLDRSVKALMWSAWKARGALREPCRGVTRDGCNYLAPCGGICNKCGHAH